LGGILVQESNFEAAAQLLGAASALSLPDESVTPSHPELFETDVEAARTTLGERAFQTAWESGRSLELADAVVLASQVETN
jgi:hypothetical protein